MKKILIIATCSFAQFIFSQKLAISQFNAGSHHSAQSAYIIGEAFNNVYQFTDGSLSESILVGVGSSVLQVGNQKQQSVKIYPNPVNHQRFFVETSVNTKGYLYSISGRFLRTIDLKSGKNEVDVSMLSSGLYLLKMETGFTNKIIIK